MYVHTIVQKGLVYIGTTEEEKLARAERVQKAFVVFH